MVTNILNILCAYFEKSHLKLRRIVSSSVMFYAPEKGIQAFSRQMYIYIDCFSYSTPYNYIYITLRKCYLSCY